MDFSRPELIARTVDNLWRYLSPAATLSDSSSAKWSGSAITDEELHTILDAHLTVSPAAHRMLDAAAEAVRRLPSVVATRYAEVDGEPEGRVDWQRTTERRFDTGEATLFVCSPVRRRFESLHARILKTALIEFERLALRSNFRGQLGRAVDEKLAQARRVLGNQKLAGVRPLVAPSESQLERAAGRYSLGPIVVYLREFLAVSVAVDPDVIGKLLRQTVFAPATDEQLFELYAGLELVRGFLASGFNLESLQALVGSRRPFAVLRSGSRRLEIWYQHSLSSIPSVPAGHSLYRRVRIDNGLVGGTLRPDFVLDGGDRFAVVEVKLSRSDGRGQLRNGIVDALGYLGDRYDVFASKKPYAVVVAWDAGSSPNPDSQIMVSDQHSTAQAASLLATAWFGPPAAGPPSARAVAQATRPRKAVEAASAHGSDPGRR